MLKDLPVFFIVFLGLLSVKRAVIHNEIETALEVLCSSTLNFQISEMNFQNERTVRQEEKYWEEDVQLYEYLLPVALRLVGTRSCFAMV